MRILLTALIFAAGLEAQPAPVKVLNGNDPVILASQNKEKEGLPSLTVARGRYLYQFATGENKAAFEKYPQQYEIQQGGMCSRMGLPVMGSPANYSVYKGRIYLFGSGDCREAFEDTPEKYIETPEVGTPGSKAEQRRASELIAKAVDALGGAAKLDAMRTIRIRQSFGADASPSERIVSARFPDEFRIEEKARFESYGVITAKDAFQVATKMERVFPIQPISAAAIRERTLRVPHFLLRNRGEFQILGVASSAEGEFAEVFFHGARVGILIDPASGQVRAVRYRGRDKTGQVGQITDLFTPETYAVEINPDLPANTFEKPVFEKK